MLRAFRMLGVGFKAVYREGLAFELRQGLRSPSPSCDGSTRRPTGIKSSGRLGVYGRPGLSSQSDASVRQPKHGPQSRGRRTQQTCTTPSPRPRTVEPNCNVVSLRIQCLLDTKERLCNSEGREGGTANLRDQAGH